MSFKPKMVSILRYWNGNPTTFTHIKQVKPEDVSLELKRLATLFPGHIFKEAK